MPLLGSTSSLINFGKIAETQNYEDAVMVFVQSSAPTYWVKITDYDDYALKVTTGNISSDGNVSFSSLFANQALNVLVSNVSQVATIGDTTLTESNLPSHRHSFDYNGPRSYGAAPPNISGPIRVPLTFNTTSNGGGGAHTHSVGDIGWTSNSLEASFSLNVKYVDCILARFEGVS